VQLRLNGRNMICCTYTQHVGVSSLLGPAHTDCTQVSFWCQQTLFAVRRNHCCLPSAGVLRIASSGVKSNSISLASVTAARYCLLVTSHINTMTMSKGYCVYAQATQWGQIAGVAAHSLAALSPAALSLVPFHLQLVGPAMHARSVILERCMAC